MPELPEVENLVRDLRPKLAGKSITEVKIARCSILTRPRNNFSKLIRKKRIEDIFRKGKCILFGLSNGYELILHLGMTGRLLYRHRDDELDTYASLYTRVIFCLDDSRHELRFADMRRFGWAAVRKRDEKDQDSYLVDRLGPDALTVRFKTFKACLASRKGTIKGLLLNQSIISGLGNIYTDESLYQAGIQPQRKANTLSDEEIKKLHKAVREVLKAAIAAGGSTVRTYRLPDGKKGRFQEQHMVYGREGRACLKCKGQIIRTEVAGRGTYYCPRCQQ